MIKIKWHEHTKKNIFETTKQFEKPETCFKYVNHKTFDTYYKQL